MSKKEVLKSPAEYLRAAKSTGSEPQIDRKGGNYSAGVIRGVSVITRGEALGHDFWVDSEFNEQVAEHINQPNKGIKSRFTHPSLSGDGLGRHLGRITNARVEGDQVIADQHFSESSHNTPDGDLASYLMELAEEDPESYGLSIVFAHDQSASEQFTADHSEGGAFLSPDPMNIENLPHSRLAELRAVDAVDEPAANPDGLFRREQEIAEEADAIASYAFGLSNEPPAVACLGIDAGRVRGFVQRFLNNNDLNIGAKQMAEETNTVEEETTESTVEVVESQEAEQPTAEAEAAPALSAKTGQDFLDAFGDQGGVWFAQGKSFDMCLALQNKALQEEVANLKQRNSAPSETGEDDAITFQAEGSDSPKGFASKIRIK